MIFPSVMGLSKSLVDAFEEFVNPVVDDDRLTRARVIVDRMSREGYEVEMTRARDKGGVTVVLKYGTMCQNFFLLDNNKLKLNSVVIEEPKYVVLFLERFNSQYQR